VELYQGIVQKYRSGFGPLAYRHPGESRGPEPLENCIPASAGMTTGGLTTGHLLTQISTSVAQRPSPRDPKDLVALVELALPGASDRDTMFLEEFFDLADGVGAVMDHGSNQGSIGLPLGEDFRQVLRFAGAA
jgi:hypothetical protein